MENWLLIQNFYHGLTNKARENLDAATGGAFMSLNINNAIALMEKMVSNQGWYVERLQLSKKGKNTHRVKKEVNVLSAKIDLLMKRLEEQANFKKDQWAIQQVYDSQVICPETQEDMNYNNNYLLNNKD
jgi:hypothetical protein